MSTRTKSPLHPSALSLNDLNVGRRIVRFNLQHGIMLEGRIVRAPYVSRESFRTSPTKVDLKVDVLVTGKYSRGIESVFVEDMGALPYRRPSSSRFGWNPSNFTVDARRRELVLEDFAKAARHSHAYYSLDHPFDDELTLEEAVGRIN